jgi:hypothetical protein
MDRYRLVRRIGAGGFGTVWLAHDERLDRPVAVKRVPTEDEAQAERVRREGLAAARLAHPGIVSLYEAGADEEACYLVSELVRGETLATLEAEGALSDRDVVEIGIVLCEALAHAHVRGVVHRDVKPGNVIVPEAVEEGGAPAKLTDFGIARVIGDDALTRTGDVLGTLAYMAPEQAEGRTVTPASDVYALGIVLYEALAGMNPVRGATPAETARRLGEPVPLLGRARRDLPRRMCEAIDAAVEVEPEERIGLVELRAALITARAAVDDEPGLVTQDGPIVEFTRRVVRAPQVREPVPVRGEAAPAEAEPWPRPWLPARIGGALGAGALAAAAVHGFDAPVEPIAAGGAVAAAVLLLPRLAWLLAVTTLLTWLLADGQTGTALLFALPRRRSRCSSGAAGRRGRWAPPRLRSAWPVSRPPTPRSPDRPAHGRGAPSSARSARCGSRSPSRCSNARCSRGARRAAAGRPTRGTRSTTSSRRCWTRRSPRWPPPSRPRPWRCPGSCVAGEPAPTPWAL